MPQLKLKVCGRRYDSSNEPHTESSQHCVPRRAFYRSSGMKKDVAQALSRAKFWEADWRQFADKLLILLVGAQGLEPWTR